jgi:hypothetical protein
MGGPVSRSSLPLQSDSGEEELARGLRWRIQNPPAALLGQSEAWHRILGDINTQRVPQPRFSAKGTSSYFVPILIVPIKALIKPCKRNSLSTVPAQDTAERAGKAGGAGGPGSVNLAMGAGKLGIPLC